MNHRTAIVRALSVVALFVAAAGAFSLNAQTIKSGSHWFDGLYYYTATVDGNIVSFESSNYRTEGPSFNLRRVADTPGEYVISLGSDKESVATMRLEIGCRAQLLRDGGVTFLAFRNKEDNVVWTLTLTAKDMDASFDQQVYDEAEPVDKMLDKYVMNTRYLSLFPVETIELMIEELTAIAGNNPGDLVQTNLSLMRSELAISNSRRLGSEVKEVTVSDEAGFLGALGNYRTVILADHTHLNLSKILASEEKCTQLGILYLGEYGDIEDREGVISEEVFDGFQLTLKNITSLTIKGGEDCSIVVEPRYANVIHLYGCENIKIENLTLGHTDEGYCEGGVIDAYACTDVEVSDCELFGCGTYGLTASRCTGISMASTVIRDCSYGVMDINNSKDLMFTGCDFLRCREYGLISIYKSQNASFTDCRMYANTGTLFVLNGPIVLKDCQIYHNLTEVGNDSLINDSKTSWNGNKAVSPRKIGPDGGKNVKW